MINKYIIKLYIDKILNWLDYNYWLYNGKTNLTSAKNQIEISFNSINNTSNIN